MADLDNLIANTLVNDPRVGGPATWRYKVLLAIADGGASGATDNELNDLLKPPGGQNNIRPRRGELVDAGFVQDSGAKRPTSSGSQATVWRISLSHRAALTPAFTEPDCDLAGQLAAEGQGGPALSHSDRQASEQLRARFALLGRRARRLGTELGVPIEAEIADSGTIGLTIWRADGDEERVRISSELSDAGLAVDAVIGAADTGNDAADSHTRQFRTQLAALSDDAIQPIDELLTSGWSLSTSSPGGDATYSSARDWVTALAEDQTRIGHIDRTTSPAEVSSAGEDLADKLTQLVRSIFPVEATADQLLGDPVQALVNGLHWDEPRARDLVALARRARQLLFAGPPGTGKTLAARILAKALADESRIKLVQFHPTYAYEDFVEGIRPALTEPVPSGASSASPSPVTTGLTYSIRPGVFKALVSAAQAAPVDVPHFIIVDEINRANLPRVFGELQFALEYRGPENGVELAYSGSSFYVPRNVWVIGTMNTADRSVAVLDAAMRRRFKEVRFDVDYTAIRRWHERNTSAELGAEAASRLKRLNDEVIELLDDDRALGHSFVIRPDLADIGFEIVWNEDLEPVLRDHLLGRTDDLPSLREAFLGSL